MTIIVAAGIASQLVTRVGFKPMLAAGLALIAAGLLWFSQVSVGGRLPRRHPRSLAARRGRARVLLRPGHDRRRLRRQGPRAGLASGLINTAQQVGGALGLAMLAAIASSVTGESLRTPGPC